MAYYFDFDEVNQIIRARFGRRVNDEMIRAFYQDVRALVARISFRAAITDFSEVTVMEVSSPMIQVLAQTSPAILDPAIPRFIVAPSPHVFGMARMFQILGGDTRPTLHVVSSASEAYAALNITDPQFKPLPG